MVTELANLNHAAVGGPDVDLAGLSVYVASLAAVRHSLSKIVVNRRSSAVNVDSDERMRDSNICIPEGKRLEDVLEPKVFKYEWRGREKTHNNGASFERTLAVLLACVSPRTLAARFERSYNLYKLTTCCSSSGIGHGIENSRNLWDCLDLCPRWNLKN